MLTRFGVVSRRGLWRDLLTFPSIFDGSLTDLTTAILEMRVTPDDRQPWRDDYGRLYRGEFSQCRPALRASTDGSGNGTLALIEPHAARFYFPAEVMRGLMPGVYEVSALATVGPETSEVLRDKVVFA